MTVQEADDSSGHLRPVVLFRAAWLLTAPMLLGLLAGLRAAHLSQVRLRGDGHGLRGLTSLVIFVALLHVALQVLPRLAWPVAAPKRFRRLSRCVVLMIGVPFAAAVAYVAQMPDGCWRTCSSFPQ